MNEEFDEEEENHRILESANSEADINNLADGLESEKNVYKDQGNFLGTMSNTKLNSINSF